MLSLKHNNYNQSWLKIVKRFFENRPQGIQFKSIWQHSAGSVRRLVPRPVFKNDLNHLQFKIVVQIILVIF